MDLKKQKNLLKTSGLTDMTTTFIDDGKSITNVLIRGERIGELISDSDGQYKFFPNPLPRHWDERVLMAILAKLETLNADYQREMEECFEKQAAEQFDRMPFPPVSYH